MLSICFYQRRSTHVLHRATVTSETLLVHTKLTVSASSRGPVLSGYPEAQQHSLREITGCRCRVSAPRLWHATALPGVQVWRLREGCPQHRKDPARLLHELALSNTSAWRPLVRRSCYELTYVVALRPTARIRVQKRSGPNSHTSCLHPLECGRIRLRPCCRQFAAALRARSRDEPAPSAGA